METSWFGLLASVEILGFVGLFTFLLHKYKINTSVYLDKITITTLFSGVVMLITNVLLILGVSPGEKHIIFFHFIQTLSLMVIATFLGVGFNQKIKNLKRLQKLGDEEGVKKLLNNEDIIL